MWNSHVSLKLGLIQGDPVCWRKLHVMDEMIPTYWLYAINSEVVIVLYYVGKELNTIPDAKLCFAMSQVYNRQSLLKVSIELSELEFIMLASVLFISDVFASGCRWILRINPTKKKKSKDSTSAISNRLSREHLEESSQVCIAAHHKDLVNGQYRIKMIALSTDQKDLHTANIGSESETFISRRSHVESAH